MGLGLNGTPLEAPPSKDEKSSPSELQRMMKRGRTEATAASAPTVATTPLQGLTPVKVRAKDTETWQPPVAVEKPNDGLERSGATALGAYSATRKVFDWD